MILTFENYKGIKNEFEVLEEQVFYRKDCLYICFTNLTTEERKKKNIDLSKISVVGFMKDAFGRSFDYAEWHLSLGELVNLDKAKTFEAREERRKKKKLEKFYSTTGEGGKVEKVKPVVAKDENGMAQIVLTKEEETALANAEHPGDFPGSESLEDAIFNDEYIGALEEMSEENKQITQKDDKVYPLEEITDLPELPEVKTPDFFDFSFMETEVDCSDIEEIEGDVVKARDSAPLKQLEEIIDKKLPGFYPIGICMEDAAVLVSGYVEYRPVVFINDEGERKFIYVSYVDWKSYCDVQAIAKKHKAAA
jgi:hypothetical protein